MVWHDCKTDPPRKSGFYLLVYNYNDGHKWKKTFDRASYSTIRSNWLLFEIEGWTVLENVKQSINAIKWAEVDLSEVE